jgi:hypothetical protein
VKIVVVSIAQAATDGNTVALAPVLIQPMAADDVATAVCETAPGVAVNGSTEIAGPERMRLDELVRRALAERHDPHDRRRPRIFPTRFDDWLPAQTSR